MCFDVESDAALFARLFQMDVRTVRAIIKIPYTIMKIIEFRLNGNLMIKIAIIFS